MGSESYKNIRMIGYAIPTTPENVISIGNPNGPGAVAGDYLGDSDIQKDVQARISIMKSAVDTAKSKIPVNEIGVINLFVIPEFYFHGLSGPYIYSEESSDPIIFIREALENTFNSVDYPDWMFVCGSVISAQVKDQVEMFESESVKSRNNIVRTLSEEWKESFGPLKGVIFDMLINFIKVCHSYPNCEVRNRSVIINNMGISSPQTGEITNLMTTEKYYVSNEDFLLYDTKNSQRVITEQMTAYPAIDLSSGDSKQTAFDQYAIFRQGINIVEAAAMDYGIEICLDHIDMRLRRNISNEPAPIVSPHIQIIPSCGMQIIPSSVATDRSGIVFNCDGQYTLNDNEIGEGKIDGVDSVYANYAQGSYGAHSQLARVKTPAVGSNPNRDESHDALFEPLGSELVHSISVENPPKNIGDYYAGGAGQIHIYGLESPLLLYPSSS